MKKLAETARHAPMLTTRQAAERLAVSTRSIARYAKDGRLPAVKVGPRLVRFRLADIERLTGVEGA